jgi:hypothetical protein
MPISDIVKCFANLLRSYLQHFSQQYKFLLIKKLIITQNLLLNTSYCSRQTLIKFLRSSANIVLCIARHFL